MTKLKYISFIICLLMMTVTSCVKENFDCDGEDHISIGEDAKSVNFEIQEDGFDLDQSIGKRGGDEDDDSHGGDDDTIFNGDEDEDSDDDGDTINDDEEEDIEDEDDDDTINDDEEEDIEDEDDDEDDMSTAPDNSSNNAVTSKAMISGNKIKK